MNASLRVAPPDVRERPILFSGAMVRAILDGRKTQTRRPIKHRHAFRTYHEKCTNEEARAFDNAPVRFPADGEAEAVEWLREHCPYGQPGDRLWVRETWTADVGMNLSDELRGAWWHEVPRSLRTERAAEVLYYRADASVYHAPRDEHRGFSPEVRRSSWEPTEQDMDGVRWIPGIHMPRWASRLTLDVVGVRVERVQDISEANILAEGVTVDRVAQWTGSRWSDMPTLHHAWRVWWDYLNAKRGYGWDVNPWVWTVEFKAVTP